VARRNARITPQTKISRRRNLMTTATINKSSGKVTQVVGVVVDVEFDGELPAIYDALTFELNGSVVYLEVAQHLSETSVRTVALGGTDGLKRGTQKLCNWSTCSSAYWS
jgi:hypothetical protein